MKELIRKIRMEAKMSQEQFASALGTTAISINRWDVFGKIKSVQKGTKKLAGGQG